MNKKGFTLVELITTFALASVVLVLLVNIVVMIKNIYSDTNVKTELLINQSNLSKALNSKLKSHKLISYTDCTDASGELLHYNFKLLDGSYTNLKVTSDKITFGKFTYKLLDGTTISPPIFSADSNFLAIKIPIHYKLYPNEDFGINLVYLGSVVQNFDTTVCSLETSGDGSGESEGDSGEEYVTLEFIPDVIDFDMQYVATGSNDYTDPYYPPGTYLYYSGVGAYDINIDASGYNSQTGREGCEYYGLKVNKMEYPSDGYINIWLTATWEDVIAEGTSSGLHYCDVRASVGDTTAILEVGFTVP